jgi:hypothetical protein
MFKKTIQVFLFISYIIYSINLLCYSISIETGIILMLLLGSIQLFIYLLSLFTFRTIDSNRIKHFITYPVLVSICFFLIFLFDYFALTGFSFILIVLPMLIATYFVYFMSISFFPKFYSKYFKRNSKK